MGYQQIIFKKNHVLHYSQHCMCWRLVTIRFLDICDYYDKKMRNTNISVQIRL